MGEKGNQSMFYLKTLVLDQGKAKIRCKTARIEIISIKMT